MKVTIHQPEHMPWLGFFHKLSCVDTLVILDNVQFRKNYFQNRNKIRTKGGWLWLSVPVQHSGDTAIKDVRIAADRRWRKKWWDSLFFSYKKAEYFDLYSGRVRDLICADFDGVSSLNVSLIKLLSEVLGIGPDYILASELNVNGTGSGLILDICKALGADEYLSGISGKDYLRLDDFSRNDIRVVFQEFHHPVYRQLHEPFMPGMSVIDLIFNYGDKSLDVIKGIGVPVMPGLFF